jgi:hypothetical protein
MEIHICCIVRIVHDMYCGVYSVCTTNRMCHLRIEPCLKKSKKYIAVNDNTQQQRRI